MIISLSILNIKKQELKAKIMEFEVCNAHNYIHFDVMDGKFVKNKTFDEKLVKEINDYSSLFKDVHLMVVDPSSMIEKYGSAGANKITFHYESVKKEDIIPLILKIKANNMKVGISLKPKTSIRKLRKYLPYIDSVLVMSVEPGQGGQSFLYSSLSKIRYLKRKQRKNTFLIEVDGGINNLTSKLVKQAGADVIIVGSYLANKLIERTLLETLN